MSDRCVQCGWPWGIGSDGLCASCGKLKANPDGLSRRTSLNGIPFKDMKQMSEAERFQFIAENLKSNRGKTLDCMVDVGEGFEDKGDRYIKGVRAIIPEVKVVARKPGPVTGVETISFKL